MQFFDLKAQNKLINKNINDAITRVINHGKFILGPEVENLEQQLCNYVGASYCISVANGTDALQIALMALDIKENDEVIVPAFSYIAAAEAVKLLNANVRYVDIDPKNFCMNVSQLEQLINERTKAIIPVSLYGNLPDYDTINKIATKYKVPIIEDAAQSFGAVYNGRKSCNVTQIACTSFFPTKPLGCYGDGGAIFTSDEVLAERIRKIARHGQSRKYHHDLLGVNSRLDTIQAAILIEKLKVLDAERDLRQQTANFYSSQLDGAVVIPYIEQNCVSAWAQYTIRVRNRKRFMDQMHSHGIPTMIHYPLALNQQKSVADYNANMPESVKAAQEVISLPIHAYLTNADKQNVIDAVLKSAS